MAKFFLQGLLLLSLAALLSASTKKSSLLNPPSIQFLQQGYNIFYGNPLYSEGMFADPGFSNYFIFDLTRDSSGDSSDEFSQQTYAVPNGVHITIGQVCYASASATELNTMEAYSNQLSVLASVDVGFIVGSFSASTDYQNMQQSLNSEQTSGYIMEGNCTAYQATVISTPSLNKQFIEDALNINYSEPTSYYDFFTKYGTHYVTDITMGAKISMISTFNASSIQTLESQGISVDVAAEASFIVSFGLSVNTSSYSAQASSASSAASSTEMISIACKPGDLKTPCQSPISNPLPISYELSSISNLFTTENFLNSTNAALLSQIVAGFDTAFGTYYNYLISSGAILQINNTTPLPPPPPPTPSDFIMCLSCGGDFPSQISIVNDIPIENWDLFYYGESCALPYTPLFGHDTSDSIVYCTNTNAYTCSYCVSCGGDYSYNVASFTAYDPPIMPGQSCGAPFDGSDDAYFISLCCQNPTA